MKPRSGAIREKIPSRPPQRHPHMVNYRRARTEGGTYFFTVTLRDRRSDALTANIDSLRKVLRMTMERRPLRMDAMVILPDHLHAVWTLPPDDADYSGRWRSIKSGFVRALRREGVPLSFNHKGECDLWQRRFWEHRVRDEEDLRRHVDYVHINPLKHGLVRRVSEWPWSTFHRYVREGKLSADWAGEASVVGEFGERP